MEKRYCIGKAEDDKQIDLLAEKYGTEEDKEYYRQMFTTVSKLACDKSELVDVKIMNSTLKELRYALKIFKRYRDIRKVVMFGSHKVKDSSREYRIAEEFSKKISEQGFMIITGGGGGIMEAGNKSAGPGKSFAVNIKLPTEQVPNPYVRGEKLITLKYFFTRKLIFIKESDATALFPGGFGTHDEAFEVLTLLQTGKTPPRPLVFVDTKFGWYWMDWFKFIKKNMLNNKLIYENDLALFKVTNDVDEAVDFVANFYRNYHSIRYVGNRTILRLNKALSEKQIELMNGNFKDILTSGGIYSCGATPEEIKNRDHLDLFRIGLNFNRYSYGRLHSLIHQINRF